MEPNSVRWLCVWALAALVTSACAPRSRYYWRAYEPSVYKMELKSDDPGAVQEGITSLNEDLERARSRDQPVPPGFHAHLGYLYTLQGDLGQAVGHFQQEKVLYPESARFIDGLLERLGVKE
ncbi:MAG: DUF4810 domain-containing protein [Myxococcota bacterium]